MVRYALVAASVVTLGWSLATAYAAPVRVPNAPVRIGAPAILVPASPFTTTRPRIKNITRVTSAETQQITIQGENFGTYTPYFGDSPYLWMDDLGVDQQNTMMWRAGCAGNAPCGTTLDVTSWTDTQIVVSGFGGGYKGNPIRRHDTLVWQVINPQTAEGPAGIVVYAR
jgi:hypothetical protein